MGAGYVPGPLGEESDTVLIFFAGHGAPETDPRGLERDGLAKYLIPIDAEAEDLYSSALPMDELQTIFGRIEAERVVAFLDACYSGAAGGRTFSSRRTRSAELLCCKGIAQRAVVLVIPRLALCLPPPLPGPFRAACGPACRVKGRWRIVEVEDLPPGRATAYTVASYVRAVLKLRALRRELAQTLLEVERRKKTINSRRQPEVLLAEAQMLLEELGIEAIINDDHSGS